MKTKKKVKKSPPKKKQMRVSGSTVKRLSKYYRTLNELIKEDTDTISSEELAKLEGVTSAQIRKDFSFFGNFGRRGLGYNTQELKTHIAGILGLNRHWNVAIVGAGNIGSALIDYAEFKAHGFHIKLVFDNDPAKIGKMLKSLIVKNIDTIESECQRENIEIAIMAIPAQAAQAVAERINKAGVKGILNFAPKRLQLPNHVVIRQENTAMELETLSYFIMNQKDYLK
ncbi:redox-sensing transcriptional repressor Rex [bacterium]|nr:redox-sensing transcriptional repressor Rex [bacterium]